MVQDAPTLPMWDGGYHQHAKTLLSVGRHTCSRLDSDGIVGWMVALQLQPLELQLSRVLDQEKNHGSSMLALTIPRENLTIST